MAGKFSVATADLTRKCDSPVFVFKTTQDLEPLDTVIGQKRAVEAIDFGLNMKGPGYNIFVTGYEGTGKSSIVKDILTRHAAQLETPPDLCLVYNFDDEYCPVALEMKSGTAAVFARRMARFVETLKIKIPRSFESDRFQRTRKETQEKYTDQQNLIFTEVETFGAALDVGILQTEKEYQAVPIKEGQPIPAEKYQACDERTKAVIQANLAKVQDKLNLALREMGKLAREMKKEFKKQVEEQAFSIVSRQIETMEDTFGHSPGIEVYLKNVQRDIVENVALFLEAGNSQAEQGLLMMADSLIARYRVNVLCDRKNEKGAPVVVETSPGFQNLFGKIERNPVGESGDFSKIRAGSVLKAHKGYLVLEIEPLLMNPHIWETLKTTLQNQALNIEDLPDQSAMGASLLKPLPIPVDVKVILLGSYEPFMVLQQEDGKFNKIFKVRADFDYEADLTQENELKYARFIARACRDENLLPFTPCGVSAILEYGSRMVEDKKKLSLRFGQVTGLLKEADYWAKKDRANVVSGEFVLKAITAHRFRHNLYEEKVQQGFDDHSILLDVSGSMTGQVNALAVYSIGEIAFGRPTRITAESYMGTPGIINVEHEADMSGQTHDKGVMIVSGYVGRMFAQNYPLSVSISITFEQSYDGIDGDSASSTELYAVLSSLSNVPIRQGIAVTGSVNQKGEIQAIGGVNEKIEGFYDVCVKKGLTGDQGVMIPAANVKNLMLRTDVVKAVGEGKFHIYAVASIEQGIEVLTGIRAGKADAQFHYPDKTVFGLVQKKLEKYHERSRAFE
ncbi:MAG: AAA family ATPase [Proteobacteria bacterium]|nr:AAA family ATPase [Desulfobacula sp.]MBU4132019.1 AAA family ATPase [Pseudomonadota bacterium]